MFKVFLYILSHLEFRNFVFWKSISALRVFPAETRLAVIFLRFFFEFSYVFKLFFHISNFEISISGSRSLLYESSQQKLGWQFTVGVPFEYIYIYISFFSFFLSFCLTTTSFLFFKNFLMFFFTSRIFEIPILGSISLLYESSQQKLGWQFTAGVSHLNIFKLFFELLLKLRQS